MTRLHHASPLPGGEEGDHVFLALGPIHEAPMHIAPTAEREGASIPLLSRWEGAGGAEGGAEGNAEGGFDHVTALADLIEIGTRVISRPMTIATPAIGIQWGPVEREIFHGYAPAAQTMRTIAWVLTVGGRGWAGWVDRHARRGQGWKADRRGVGWRRLQRDAHPIWPNRRGEGAGAAQPLSGCAGLNRSHPGGNSWANLKSSSHRCHLFEVAFVWESTQ